MLDRIRSRLRGPTPTEIARLGSATLAHAVRRQIAGVGAPAAIKGEVCGAGAARGGHRSPQHRRQVHEFVQPPWSQLAAMARPTDAAERRFGG